MVAECPVEAHGWAQPETSLDLSTSRSVAADRSDEFLPSEFCGGEARVLEGRPRNECASFVLLNQGIVPVRIWPQAYNEEARNDGSRNTGDQKRRITTR